MVEWNNTQADFPAARCGVHQLIEAQAVRTPGRVAVVCEGDSLTYAELNRRADLLAGCRPRGVKAGGRVGILIDRSLDMLVALLAVMKAGHAYVPLDPEHPPARLALILGEARTGVLLSNRDEAAALLPEGALLVRLDREAAAIAARPATPPEVRVRGEDLAYVIFTSGSTGTPKGVEIPHRAVVNLLLAMAAEPGLTARDTLLAVTTIAFDIAALELFGPLIVGGQVEIAAREEAADGFALLGRLELCGASVIQATPSLWQMLLDAGFRPAPGMKLLCGGETLTRALADRLLEGGGELWNMYGPTETTIWSSTAGRILPDGARHRSASRSPTPASTWWTTPAACAVGVAGELYRRRRAGARLRQSPGADGGEVQLPRVRRERPARLTAPATWRAASTTAHGDPRAAWTTR